MDVKAVRLALAAAVAPIRLGGKKMQALGLEPGSITPPTFYTAKPVTLDRYPDDDDTNGRLRKWTFVGKILVGQPDEQAAQEALDALMSDGDADVVAALEAESTLGGLIADIRVDGITNSGPQEVGGNIYLGANVGITLWSF